MKKDLQIGRGTLLRTVEDGVTALAGFVGGWTAAVFASIRSPLRAASSHAARPERYAGPQVFLLLSASIATLLAFPARDPPQGTADFTIAFVKSLQEVIDPSRGLLVARFLLLLLGARVGGWILSAASRVTEHELKVNVYDSVSYLMGVQVLLLAAVSWIFATREILRMLATPFVEVAALFNTADALGVGLVYLQMFLVVLCALVIVYPGSCLLSELRHSIPRTWPSRIATVGAILLATLLGPASYSASHHIGLIAPPSQPAVLGSVTQLTNQQITLVIQNNTGTPLPLESGGLISVLGTAHAHEFAIDGTGHRGNVTVIAKDGIESMVLFFVQEGDRAIQYQLRPDEERRLTTNAIDIVIDVPAAFQRKVGLRTVRLRCPPLEPRQGVVLFGAPCGLKGIPW